MTTTQLLIVLLSVVWGSLLTSAAMKEFHIPRRPYALVMGLIVLVATVIILLE